VAIAAAGRDTVGVNSNLAPARRDAALWTGGDDKTFWHDGFKSIIGGLFSTGDWTALNRLSAIAPPDAIWPAPARRI
jgi:hypothetical protein